jgi:hypothetical protein
MQEAPAEEAHIDEPADDDTPAVDDAAEVADVSAQPDEAPSDVAPGASVVESPPGTVQGRRSPSGRGARRAAVPTWDDIMFGMKPKDGS